MLPPHPVTTRAPIFYKRNTPQAMTEAQSLPLGVPIFKPLRAPTNIQSMVKRPMDPITQKGALHQYPAPNLAGLNSTFGHTRLHNSSLVRPNPSSSTYKVPAFQALPSSVTRISSGQPTVVFDMKKPTASNVIEPEFTTIQRSDVSYSKLIDESNEVSFP